MPNRLLKSFLLKAKSKKTFGPIMIVIKIKNSKETGGRVPLEPPDIKKRFMRTIVCD